jgi:hypothetical protein
MPISNPNSGGGAVNRIIEIDCKDQKIFTNPRETADTIQNNYGFTGRQFIEAISAPEETAHARKLFVEFSKALAGGISTEKQIMAAALLLTADKLSEEIVFQDGLVLAQGDIEQFLTSKDDVDQNMRAYEWLFDFVSSNPARFKLDDNSGELWGCQDKDYIYIIKSIFDAKMQEQGFNSTSFLSWAKRRDIIEGGNESKNTKVKWIGGVGVRCVWLNRTKIAGNFVKIDEEEEIPF